MNRYLVHHHWTDNGNNYCEIITQSAKSHGELIKRLGRMCKAWGYHEVELGHWENDYTILKFTVQVITEEEYNIMARYL